MSEEPPSLAAVLAAADWESRLTCGDDDVSRMRQGVTALDKALAAGTPVYGVTRGFGALVGYSAAESSHAQGQGLIAHLGTAQGPALPPEVCRLVVWLRLSSMRLGYSAVSPEFWHRVAALWNRGFTPAIPRDGTVSASGDLQPLASAALALSGEGQAWVRQDDASWAQRPAREALRTLGEEPLSWPAREALAFVNGTSVGLALTIHNERQVRALARAAAALTGRMAALLGADPDAYHDGLAGARGHPGQALAARWIRAQLPAGAGRAPARPLQEPYSLRCSPQVLGAVVDQLDAIEAVLAREAGGCSDNPVYVDGEVRHGGNFHAMPVALCSDQLALCLHQVAYLADRQLALLCAPETNGGLAPMLTPHPGAASGLAGVQISATSFVSRIRQSALPASLTALPCNNGNQDHVPMALNGANATAEAVEHAWLVLGSLGVGLAQYAALAGRDTPDGQPWAEIAEASPPLDLDRPMAEEVRSVAALLRIRAERWCAAEPTEGAPR